MRRWISISRLLIHHTKPFSYYSSLIPNKPLFNPSTFSSNPYSRFNLYAPFSSIPSSALLAHDFDFDTGSGYYEGRFSGGEDSDELTANVPVKAFFLSTSINLKSIHAENIGNVVPSTSRNSNYITLRFSHKHAQTMGIGSWNDVVSQSYMVVFHYGSAVLFNVDDHEVDFFLNIARRHASGVLREMKKDDYTVKEKPTLIEDMQGGPDYIVLKHLDTDGIRIIGSVLGQSIALDYFVSQVDLMVEEFAGINRAMEKTGTFTMHRKKLFQLVGKANSNIADVILKVGLFDSQTRNLREEYEVTQRFGNLDIKLKFIEHNIHFLQEVLQNRRSDLLEWCIIVLLSIENVIGIYEIVKDF